MAQAPQPVRHVQRTEVSDVVKDIMFESDVKWVAVEFAGTEAGVDFFDITPWTSDPR
jgi:hypothetical protein